MLVRVSCVLSHMFKFYTVHSSREWLGDVVRSVALRQLSGSGGETLRACGPGGGRSWRVSVRDGDCVQQMLGELRDLEPYLILSVSPRR